MCPSCRTLWGSTLTLFLLTTACRPILLVPLRAAPNTSAAAAQPAMDDQLFLVVTRAAEAEPLRLAGTWVSYGSIDQALSGIVRKAAMPWARRHRDRRPDGWQLLIELTHAEAARRRGRVTVSLGIRATLHARAGNLYLGQTQGYCQESAEADSREAAATFYACMQALGRDLSGWLSVREP